MIKIGIIGCGLIGGVHSRALKGLIKDGVDAAVIAACDTDEDRAQAFVAAQGGELATTDPEAVVEVVDAVWVCTPTSTHRALVELAADAGRAVFCEKPLAPTMVDVMAMADTVERAGVIHQVGLVMRAMGPLIQLHRLATADGAIGRPMAAVFRDDQFFPIQGHYASLWRADVAMAGGGTLIEHSIHDLDILAWVLGDVTEVTCRTANYAGHPGIEDVAAATLVHASGATSTLVSVWHQVLTRPSLRRIEVFCERAMLWLDDQDAGPVHVETDSGAHVVEAASASGLIPYAAADRAFLEAVQAGTRATPGFEVAVTAHRIADACYRSAALGGSPTAVALL